MEQWTPLNLVKKEATKAKPVAVVAPSSVTVARTDEEKPIEIAKTSTNNSVNYQIDRLLGRQSTEEETNEIAPNSKIEMPSLVEQQILAAVYMRDFVNTYNSLFPNYIPNQNSIDYNSTVFDNYKKIFNNNGREEKPDSYPHLREQLNCEPNKPDYETSIDSLLRNSSPEPLNLQMNRQDDVPLDCSKKRGFLLTPNQSLSLLAPELESITKPLVLTIPNPQERSIKPRRRERSNKSKRSSSLDLKNSGSSHHTSQDSKSSDAGSQNDKKKPHIKKPLNAFMLYMKEMRAKVVAECTLKESAAINQILGRRWHALGREEQAKYYELARRERQLHMQLYPDWSSRANSSRGKKRKRKQEANDGGSNMKKCRARYGLDQQSQWCKPCRRKKKCIRYMESGEERDGNQSEDNGESCGSVGDATTPPDDDDCGESLAHSMSSPGGLSGLSSLTSPSMILPSPSTSLASPSVSLASPCMSLQSPLTPPAFDMKPILPLPLPPLHRNPVGTNPHDVNNPLSVNQLTGKCIKSEPKERSRPISVT